MTYQVLARKWRPKIFKNIVGQNHVITMLSNTLSLKKIHHAYLFSGTRGVGKTSIARLLAKSLNCKNGILITPCNKCDHCLEIEQGTFSDLLEIDGASRTKVEEIREILDSIQYLPVNGRFKIYLIDEVHMLSRHSFNALLKTLEEPPIHVKFFLVTTDIQKLPITVLSRCLQFQLKALEEYQIVEQLKFILNEEKIKYDLSALHLLAQAAEGSMRDALSLTEQAITIGKSDIKDCDVINMLGIVDHEHSIKLIEAINKGSAKELMVLIQKAALQGVNWDLLLIEMLKILHNIAIAHFVPETLNIYNKNYSHRIKNLLNILTPEDVQLYYQILLMGRKDLSFAPTQRLGVEMTLLRALAFHPQPQPSDSILKNSDSPICTSSHALSVSNSCNQKNPLTSWNTKKKSLNNNENMEIQTKKEYVKNNNNFFQKNLLNQNKILEQLNIEKSPNIISKNIKLNQLDNKRLDESIKLKETTTSIKHNPKREEEKNTIYKNKVNILPLKMDILSRKSSDYLVGNDKKKFNLNNFLTEETKKRDAWAEEIDTLVISKNAKEIALNSWKETHCNNSVTLHLRSQKYHLNSSLVHQDLKNALSKVAGKKINLIIVKDDDDTFLTPLEWHQKIYEEKLKEAHQTIENEENVKMLKTLFNAEVDRESIKLI